MKICGIIVEYNPFHNGHLYHIEQAKKQTRCDLLIACMSGHFVQRGEPSIIDKWTRAHYAVINGVDLVVELPYVFSCESADYFSKGALQILNHLKINSLVFGSETLNQQTIHHALQIIQSSKYQECVQSYLSLGNSYPTSLGKALEKLASINIFNPNDVLGLTYAKEIKANHYPIDIIPILRTQSFYNDDASLEHASASAIRKAIFNNQTNALSSPIDFKEIKDFHCLNDYFDLLSYTLLTSSKEQLRKIHGMDEGLENRMLKYIQQSISMTDFISKVQTKRYTLGRIQRAIIHLLMQDTLGNREHLDVGYIRILAMNQKGRNYIKQIKNSIPIPIISNFSSLNHPYLDYELKATQLYSLGLKDPQKRIELMASEYKNFAKIL